MSVSGPLRTLVKPYCNSDEKEREQLSVRRRFVAPQSFLSKCIIYAFEILRELTKFRFLWNELNFFVRKYFGKTEVVNPSTSRIWNANPDSDQEM